MGAEDQVPQNGVTTVTDNGAAVADGGASTSSEPAVPEPPKIEEIVTPEVVQQIVTGYNPDLSLVSFKAEIGSKIGDNYMSILYSVVMELEDKQNGAKETLQAMLKTLPRSSFHADVVNEMQAFKKEAVMYNEVLPTFIQTQKERHIPESELFRPWPQCYASYLDGKADYLAMENLKIAGYKMGSRVDGLDFNHCTCVLRTLAKHHAISYAKYGGSREKILEDFPMLNCGMFDRDSKLNDVNSKYFSQSFKSIAKSLSKTGEDLAASRLEKLGDIDISIVFADLTSQNIEQAVIIHGDFWVNNMLFKYSENDTNSSYPLDVKLIDFQLSMATSRLIDIYYFLFNSSKLDVLNNREEDLLMTYYAEFTSHAERLGVNTKEKGLTWENLLKEADQFRFYGVCIGILFAPMLSADSADIPDMSTITMEDMEKDDAVKKFCEDLSSDFVLQKSKCIAINHLPKCNNAGPYL